MKQNEHPDSKPYAYGEDNENPQIDENDIIRELRKSRFDGMDDYLDEFDDEEHR